MKILEKVDEIKEKKTIKVKEILKLLGKESFFQILFISTIFTSIPAPAWGIGFSTIPAGIITFLISIQLILDYKYVVLPDFINEKEIKTSILKGKSFKTIKKWFAYLKGMSSPRLKKVFKSKNFNKIAGLSLLPQGILMIIPIIFTNLLPSMIVTGLSLAYILKDGVLFFIFCLMSFIVFFTYIFFFKYLVSYLKYISNKVFNTNYSY